MGGKVIGLFDYCDAINTISFFSPCRQWWVGPLTPMLMHRDGRCSHEAHSPDPSLPRLRGRGATGGDNEAIQCTRA